MKKKKSLLSLGLLTLVLVIGAGYAVVSTQNLEKDLNAEILLKENHEKTGAYFVIPSNTKVLYVYRLKVSDIKKEIQRKS